MAEQQFELGSGDSLIERIRHSAAHIMAQAVKRLHPEAQFGIGPTIENGFYYDMKLDKPLTEDDLKKIEKEMKKIVSSNFTFERSEMNSDEALKFFEQNNQKYKLEIINDLKVPTVSIYKQGEFIDLCRGPHIEKTSQLKHFKLLRVSGAYWRGDQAKDQLQRVYGTAFETEAELKQYLTMLEEAAKRDHRKIGTELDLFMFHPWAPASPFFFEKGARVYHTLQKWIRTYYDRAGYQEIITPQIFDTELWKVSGHYEHYKDGMFFSHVENKEYGVKPMNCPSHCLMFRARKHSYRELPIRMADFGRLHRYELSGATSGLTRVRSMCQDDAHIFCRVNQIQAEIADLMTVIRKAYDAFAFTNLEIFLSTKPDNALGSAETWEKAEKALSDALETAGLEYKINPKDGAFYGPKIDCNVTDAIGRKWQVATIQLDFQMPERFELKYTNENNEDERPVMIHRAVLGTFERFLGVLIEHTMGVFPAWLAPVQARIIPVSDEQKDYARKVLESFKAVGARADLDDRNESLGKKTRETQKEKIPFMIVVGKKEMDAGEVSVRRYGSQDQTNFSLDEFVKTLKAEVTLPVI